MASNFAARTTKKELAFALNHTLTLLFERMSPGLRIPEDFMPVILRAVPDSALLSIQATTPEVEKFLALVFDRSSNSRMGRSVTFEAPPVFMIEATLLLNEMERYLSKNERVASYFNDSIQVSGEAAFYALIGILDLFKIQYEVVVIPRR